MSGGHWDYSGRQVNNLLEAIAQDEEVLRRWPITASILEQLGDVIYAAEHDMDWDLSSDTLIDDDAQWDRGTAAALMRAVVEKLPDAWFPRGKWATIQAVSERADKAR